MAESVASFIATLLGRHGSNSCDGNTKSPGKSSTQNQLSCKSVKKNNLFHAFNWSPMQKFGFSVCVALAILTRFWHISKPTEVVFDEVHFGKFASYYIRGEYFFDVHPPLGKLIFAGVAKLFAYDGWFSFDKIGTSYTDAKVPYVAMRSISALCNVLTVGLVYAMLVEMKFSLASTLIGTCCVLFDNALVTQSRLILLDAQLILFITCSCYCWIRFRKLTKSAFLPAWWMWLTLTGVSLGLAVGVKFVGLFVIFLIGSCTLYDLWDLCRPERTPNIRVWFYHWIARIICLIIVPLAVFLVPYYLHFAVLNKSGTGDEYMTPKFQSSLKGNQIVSTAHPIYYGSVVTIRSKVENIYLHSHSFTYPLRHLDGKVSSQGQQVTGYPTEDSNNDWMILPQLDDEKIMPHIEKGRIPVKNGDLVRVLHIKTKKFLLTHDVASPLTVTNQEVAAFDVDGIESKKYQGTLWRVEIHKGDKDILKSKLSHFRLTHHLTGCSLFNFQQNLPDWAFGQREINAVRNETTPSLWFIDDVLPPGGWLPEEQKENEKINKRGSIGFWDKFVELFLLSLLHNSILADRNPYMTAPWKWPLLIRGIAYWCSNDKMSKMYLLGNVITWYFSLISIPLFLIGCIIYLVGQQRKIILFNRREISFLFSKGGFFLLGYLFHYGPFFLMGRSLYFHHYLPCYLFNALLATSFYEIISSKCKLLRKSLVVFSICILIIAIFYQFSPLVYATVMKSEQQFNKLKWIKSWHFIQ